MSDNIQVTFRQDKDHPSYFNSKRIIMGDEDNDFYSFVETDIRMSVDSDTGSIYLSDMNRDGGVFIYPEQLPHLRKMLEAAELIVSSGKAKVAK